MADDVVRQHVVDGVDYPPGLTGWRGSHPGSFDVAHEIRDGRRFDPADLPIHDRAGLVVVGAGMSGLAAAWFAHRARPDASIVIIDNHDDFGGHAKRNEFTVDGRLLLGYGGTESLQSPDALYGPEANGLLRHLGVDYHRFARYFDTELYPSLGLSRGVFFTREAFGEDRLVTGDPMRMVADDIPPGRMHERPAADFLADYPVSERERQALIALYTSDRNPLPDLDEEGTRRLLSSISYRDYLQRYWDVDGAGADSFEGRAHDFFAIGIGHISAFTAMETGYPGFAGIDLPRDPDAEAEMEEPYIYHFPDGNASLARLLVRSLIPAVAQGETMEDVVTARFDYGALDRPGAPVRLRLASTVVHLANDGDGVDLGYVRGDELVRMRARHLIFAGYHMMAPAIMRELPTGQRRALRSNVKAPLSYTKVAVHQWRPWVRAGVHEITNPMGFFSRLKLDYPVSIGSYRFGSGPDEPMVLHLVHVPVVRDPSLSVREARRLARERFYATTFDEFEFHVRDELTRMLGRSGFDADADIAAITVNRWGHGYAYSGDELHPDPREPDRPFEIARARCGNVAFAGSDAAWMPLTSAAIAEAHRAVLELFDGA